MIDDLIKRFVDEAESSIAAEDWTAYGSIFAEDLYMVTPMNPEPTTGRKARVELVKAIMAPFPDGVVKVQRRFGQGEWACVEVLFTGTHTEPMVGADGAEIAPTHKPVTLPYCMIMKFKDGLVSELYEYYDQLNMLAQLGLV